jgi:hypothetical protein
MSTEVIYFLREQIEYLTNVKYINRKNLFLGTIRLKDCCRDFYFDSMGLHRSILTYEGTFLGAGMLFSWNLAYLVVVGLGELFLP